MYPTPLLLSKYSGDVAVCDGGTAPTVDYSENNLPPLPITQEIPQ